MKTILAILLTAATTTGALALEGKWTPQQVLELDPQWLKTQGLELSPKQLWDPERGTGLLAGAVNIGGCSGGFISGTGLIVTNHHCVFGILQEHSTPQNDIITNGFLARTKKEELPGKGLRVTVPRKFVDVTREVLAAVPAGADDLARFRAIERKEKELVARCEEQPATRCKVARLDGGVQYVLVDAFEISDIRLVWAPPRAVGEYGGEIDNWMWPRHTGDFSIARAWVTPEGTSSTFSAKNVPFKPEFFFPISARGVRPGDFVMVLGYPGITYRSLTADEMSERRDLFFARREEIYGEWIGILEETSKGNPAAEIAVADNLKTLLNRYKNAQGQLAGFKRGRILEKQRESEQGVIRWAEAKPGYRDALRARNDLTALVDEQRKTWEHDFLLGLISVGPKSLYHGTTLVRASRERTKADLEREADYMERNLPRVREKLEREEKNYFAAADKKLFASLVRRAMALPAGQRIEAIDKVFAEGKTEAEIAGRIDELYRDTKVLNLVERLEMFGETSQQLRARRDPILELSIALDNELYELKERKDRWEGTITRFRPEWRRAVMAAAGKPVAPDASSTLRVSFAHVKGYEPRDGVFYTPQTTLTGAVEKHTGVEPFDLPEDILRAASAKMPGRWKDPKLGDVPVGFLADADTTGGSSGSPTVNGKGELVGVNFDRVWENVANDFGYNPDIARNVNADVRYLLWILDQVQDADALLRELGVRK